MHGSPITPGDICPPFATSFIAPAVCIVKRLWTSNKHPSKINKYTPPVRNHPYSTKQEKNRQARTIPHLDIRPGDGKPLEHDERKVGEDAALVHLVEHDVRGQGQVGVGAHPLQQHGDRAEGDRATGTRGAVLQPDVVTNGDAHLKEQLQDRKDTIER